MVLGSFYFRLTANGNLIGEFTNTEANDVFSESANKIPNQNTDSYEGEYNSTWFGGGANTARLSIRIKIPNQNLFILEWADSTGIIFRGEGFINNGEMIGAYWDNDLHQRFPNNLILRGHRAAS